MNRHKKLAILMAPFLAVAGYIIAGYMVDAPEPPMRALVMEKDCRITAADCLLQTLGLSLNLSADQKLEAGQSVTIKMTSSEKLDDALISFAGKKQQSRPHRLYEKEENIWQESVFIESDVDTKQLYLRLVVGWQGSIYFADEKIQQ
ncbi:MAG: hypothetical protein OEY36_12080 [Gammaproteobacteria bacterium]|nr:hypothetical protein [Gammaproteobacteria bacterium]